MPSPLGCLSQTGNDRDGVRPIFPSWPLMVLSYVSRTPGELGKTGRSLGATLSEVTCTSVSAWREGCTGKGVEKHLVPVVHRLAGPCPSLPCQMALMGQRERPGLLSWASRARQRAEHCLGHSEKWRRNPLPPWENWVSGTGERPMQTPYKTQRTPKRRELPCTRADEARLSASDNQRE